MRPFMPIYIVIRHRLYKCAPLQTFIQVNKQLPKYMNQHTHTHTHIYIYIYIYIFIFLLCRMPYQYIRNYTHAITFRGLSNAKIIL